MPVAPRTPTGTGEVGCCIVVFGYLEMCEDLPDEISLEPLLGLETCIDVRPDVVSDVLNAGVVDFGDVDDNEAMLAFAQDDE